MHVFHVTLQLRDYERELCFGFYTLVGGVGDTMKTGLSHCRTCCFRRVEQNLVCSRLISVAEIRICLSCLILLTPQDVVVLRTTSEKGDKN